MTEKEDKIFDYAIMIHHHAEVIKGYCQKAGGTKTFVDCLVTISNDIMDMAFEINQIIQSEIKF